MKYKKLILICLCGVMLLLAGLMAKLSLDSYKKLDYANLEDDAQRGVRAFSGQIDLMKSKFKDWTTWDEVYKYVKERTPGFVEANFPPAILKNIGVSEFAILDENLDIAFAVATIPNDDKIFSNWSSEKLKLLNKNSSLIQNSEKDFSFQFIKVANDISVIFSRGVTTGDSQSPQKGRLVFIVKLDSQFSDLLSKQTLLSMEINPAESIKSNIFQDIIPLENNSKIYVSKNNAIAIQPFLDDSKKTIGVLKITLNRTIAEFGRVEVAKSFIIQSIASILLIIGFWYGLSAAEFRTSFLKALKDKKIVEERESYLSALFTAVPSTIIWFNSKNICEGFKFDGMEGQQKIEKGKPIEALTHLMPNETIQKILDFKASSELKCQSEYSHLINGQLKTFLLSLIKYDSNQKLMLSITDVTERFELQQKIEEQRQQMMQSARLSSLGEMAGGIAHEINNPLSILSFGAYRIRQKLKDNPAMELVQSYLKSFDDTIDRINIIITSLLKISRDGSEDPINPSLIKDIILEIQALCSERLRINGIQFDFKIENEQALVLCRAVQLSQVLLNLINNAFDAINHLEKKWVQLNVYSENEYIVFEVTDSGNGIPPQVAEKMMDPFYTTKEVGKGTGLGLSISKANVESQGGKLVYNAKSNHTQFKIYLLAHLS